MEFSAPREDLLRAVGNAAHIAAVRGGVAALGGALLRWGAGEVVLTATNLDLSVEVRLPVADDGEGEALVPARLLLDVLRAAPEGNVHCQLEPQENSFLVRWERGQLALRTLHREDYPNLSFSLGDDPAFVKAANLVRGVAQVARAASRDETRPLLTGIDVGVSDGLVELVATDSYRLAVRRIKAGAKGEFKATIPATALAEVARVASQGEVEEIGIGLVERRAVFAVGDVVISSRLLEGQFPDYRQLLPEDPPVQLDLDQATFSGVLRRVGLVAQRNTPVSLTLADGELVVAARTPDIGEAEERLGAGHGGAPLTVAFNPTYLKDGVEAVGSGTFQLKLTNSVRPGVIEAEEEDGELIYLVMPVRLD